MSSQEASIQGLLAQVYKTMNAAKTIAVLGWKPNWHDEWTKLVEHQRHAIFVDQVGQKIDLGTSIGYVLYTHRIGHNVVHRLKGRKPIAPVCLRPHQIHELFRIWCEQMQWSSAVRRRAWPASTTETRPRRRSGFSYEKAILNVSIIYAINQISRKYRRFRSGGRSRVLDRASACSARA
jgi:hypothetical protein